MPEPKTKDWVTPVVVVLGAGGIAAGLYLALRKPPGVSRGGIIRAHFSFNYYGISADYILLVRFGYHRLSGLIEWFDPEEGMDRYILAVSLLAPDSYEFDVNCRVPDTAPVRSYDAEGSILTPDMELGKNWILRVFKDKAISVRKD